MGKCLTVWAIVLGCVVVGISAFAAGGQNKSLGASTAARFTLSTTQTWPSSEYGAEVCLWKYDRYAAVSPGHDDNMEWDIPFLLNISDTYGIPFTWWLITDNLTGTKSGRGTWAQWNEVWAYGVSHGGKFAIESHSATHESGKNLSDTYVHDTMYGPSLADIRSNIPGDNPLTVAWAYGAAYPNALTDLIISARGTSGTPNQANKVNYMNVNAFSSGAHPGYLNAILNGKPGTKTTATHITADKYRRAWFVPFQHNEHTSHGVPQSGWESTVASNVLDYATLATYRDYLWLATYPAVAKYSQSYCTASVTVGTKTASQIRFTLSDDMYDAWYDEPLTVKIRLPSGWSQTGVTAMQGGKILDAFYVVHDGGKYALVNAVPDAGEVTLTPSSANSGTWFETRYDTPPYTYRARYFDTDGRTVLGYTNVVAGTSATAVAPKPVKSGYVASWTNRDTATCPSAESVTDDLDLVLKWTSSSVSYTVRFDLNGGSGSAPDQSVPVGGLATEPAPAPTRSGKVFDGWYNGSVRWDFTTMPVTAAITLVAAWADPSDPTTYTVTFDADGGTPVPGTLTVAAGGKVTKPGDPAKSGYTFAGWYNGDTPWNFATDTVTANLALKAKWTAAPVPTPGGGFSVLTWRMPGELNDAKRTAFANEVTTDNARFVFMTGGKCSGSSSLPVVDGYKFYSAPQTVNTSTGSGSGNTWGSNAGVEHTIYYPSDYTVIDAVKHPATATQSEANAATFIALSKDGQDYIIGVAAGYDPQVGLGYVTNILDNAIKLVSNPIIILAFDTKNSRKDKDLLTPFRDAIKARGFAEGTSSRIYSTSAGVPDYPMYLIYVKGVDAAITETGKENSIFDTKEDNTCYQYGSLFTLGTAAPTFCNVTFDAASGSPTPESQVVAAGGKVDRPDDPYREGYDLVGWFVGDTDKEWDFATDTVTGDLTLKAHWRIMSFSVNFDTDGGEPEPEAQLVAWGGKVTKPATDPVKPGYSFLGWFDGNGVEWDFDNDTVTDYVTLFAYWREELGPFTVSFDLNGGTSAQPSAQVIAKGGLVSDPGDPSRSGGWDFVGWYHGDDYWNIETEVVTGDMTLTAHWQERTCTVSFNTDGGSAVSPMPVHVGWPISPTPAAPTKADCLFNGWYNGDDYWNIDTDVVTSNMTLTAKWSSIAKPVGGSADLKIMGWGMSRQHLADNAAFKNKLTDVKPAFLFLTRARHQTNPTFPDNYSYSKANVTGTSGVGQLNSNAGDGQFMAWDKSVFSETATADRTEEGMKNDSGESQYVSYSVLLTTNDGSKKYVFTLIGAGVFKVGSGTDYQNLLSKTLDLSKLGISDASKINGWFVAYDTQIFNSDTYKSNLKTALEGSGFKQLTDQDNWRFYSLTTKGIEVEDTDSVSAFVISGSNYSEVGSLVTLSATIPVPSESYVATFNLNGGNIYGATTNISTAVDKTKSPAESGVVPYPVKPGYTLGGWTPSVDAVMTGDTTYTAQWVQDNICRVVFNADGGEPTPLTQTVEKGARATRPTDPVKNKHLFVGWYAGDTEWNFDSPVTANLNLTARWQPAPPPPGQVPLRLLVWSLLNGKTAQTPSDGSDLTAALRAEIVTNRPALVYLTDLINGSEFTVPGYEVSAVKDGSGQVMPKLESSAGYGQIFLWNANVFELEKELDSTFGSDGTTMGKTVLRTSVFTVKGESGRRFVLSTYQNASGKSSLPIYTDPVDAHFASVREYLGDRPVEGWLLTYSLVVNRVPDKEQTMSDYIEQQCGFTLLSAAGNRKLFRSTDCPLVLTDDYAVDNVMVASDPDGDPISGSVSVFEDTLVPDSMFTAMFNTAGGTPLPENQTRFVGSYVVEPTDPSNDPYVFGGWYDGERKWNFDHDVLLTNVTLRARWTFQPYSYGKLGVMGWTLLADGVQTAITPDRNAALSEEILARMPSVVFLTGASDDAGIAAPTGYTAVKSGAKGSDVGGSLTFMYRNTMTNPTVKDVVTADGAAARTIILTDSEGHRLSFTMLQGDDLRPEDGSQYKTLVDNLVSAVGEVTCKFFGYSTKVGNTDSANEGILTSYLESLGIREISRGDDFVLFADPGCDILFRRSVTNADASDEGGLPVNGSYIKLGGTLPGATILYW